ncbi:hypothetical protein ACFL35_21635, partial [Candidatus Riflebacteria bacterium]
MATKKNGRDNHLEGMEKGKYPQNDFKIEYLYKYADKVIFGIKLLIPFTIILFLLYYYIMLFFGFMVFYFVLSVQLLSAPLYQNFAIAVFNYLFWNFHDPIDLIVGFDGVFFSHDIFHQAVQNEYGEHFLVRWDEIDKIEVKIDRLRKDYFAFVIFTRQAEDGKFILQSDSWKTTSKELIEVLISFGFPADKLQVMEKMSDGNISLIYKPKKECSLEKTIFAKEVAVQGSFEEKIAVEKDSAETSIREENIFSDIEIGDRIPIINKTVQEILRENKYPEKGYELHYDNWNFQLLGCILGLTIIFFCRDELVTNLFFNIRGGPSDMIFLALSIPILVIASLYSIWGFITRPPALVVNFKGILKPYSEEFPFKFSLIPWETIERIDIVTVPPATEFLVKCYQAFVTTPSQEVDYFFSIVTDLRVNNKLYLTPHLWHIERSEFIELCTFYGF